MQFDYKTFHIDCRSRHTDEGEHMARALITRRGTQAAHPVTHDSGEIDSFSTEGDAIACARNWAIDWCDAETRKG